MRIAPLSLLAALAAFAVPATAVAAPPQNDNYLASVPVGTPPFQASVDTSEATTQLDTYNPNADGQPFSGGGAENLACQGVGFGKTVWYDLRTEFFGSVDISAASSTFAPAVALYEYDGKNPRDLRLVSCTTTVGGKLFADIQGKHFYTIQVGGVNGAGGPLNLSVDYISDQDEDGEYDATDKCPKVAGTVDGCPPELKATPALNFNNTGNGIRISRLIVDRVPKGAKVVAKCTGCGSQTVKVSKTGRVTLTKLVGKTVRAGGNVEISVTLAKTGNKTYRFGATGAYFKWPVKASGIGSRQTKCLNVKSGKIEKCG